MTKKWMTALALALLAPAAFGQTVLPAIRPKKEKPVPMSQTAAGVQIKALREAIKRDKNELSAKRKAEKTAKRGLLEQEKTDAAKARGAAGTRAEKKKAGHALRAKYESMMKDERSKRDFARKELRDDIRMKSDQIKRLRQS